MLNFSDSGNGGMPTMGQAMGAPAPIGAQKSINLQKGQRISLTKQAPGLKHVMVGLGWTTQQYTNGSDFDLDASAFMVKANGKTDPSEMIYYNTSITTPDGRKCDPAQSVIHSGDSRSGGDGNTDDEQITVDLEKVPDYIEKIAISVTIYEADRRGQNFGMVSHAYIRLVNDDTGAEIARFDMGEEFSTETAVVIGEIYRNRGEWKFNPVGAGYAGGMVSVCAQYGLDAGE